MEILNIPDNIPKTVLDKSECVIVIPSVKKLALGVGGNYGRGAMTCRGGKAFTGPGDLRRWLRWKAAISGSKSAVRPLTLCCSWSIPRALIPS